MEIIKMKPVPSKNEYEVVIDTISRKTFTGPFSETITKAKSHEKACNENYLKFLELSSKFPEAIAKRHFMELLKDYLHCSNSSNYLKSQWEQAGFDFDAIIWALRKIITGL